MNFTVTNKTSTYPLNPYRMSLVEQKRDAPQSTPPTFPPRTSEGFRGRKCSDYQLRPTVDLRIDPNNRPCGWMCTDETHQTRRDVAPPIQGSRSESSLLLGLPSVEWKVLHQRLQNVTMKVTKLRSPLYLRWRTTSHRSDTLSYTLTFITTPVKTFYVRRCRTLFTRQINGWVFSCKDLPSQPNWHGQQVRTDETVHSVS